MSSCRIPPNTDTELNDGATAILKAAGAQACNNNSRATQLSASAEISASAGFGLAEMGGSLNASYADSASSSIGCEQLAVMSQQFASATKKISCFLNEDSKAISKTVKNINKISFKAGGNLRIRGDIDIKQDIDMKLIDLNTLSSSVKQAISDEVYTTAMQTLDAVQNSKSGFGATPQGSKTIADAKSRITNENVTDIVNKTITDIKINVSNNNELIFESKGDLDLDKEFKVNQNILVDITSTAILTNAVDSALKTFTKTMSTQTSKISQIADNLGAESLGKQAGEAAAALVAARKKDSVFAGVGAIAAIILVGVVLFFASGKNGKPIIVRKWVAGFIIVVGIILLIAGSLMTYWGFSGYDEAYAKKVNAEVEEFKKCINVENKKEECSIKKLSSYEEPLGYKIGGIVLLVFGLAFFVFGFKLLLFNTPAGALPAGGLPAGALPTDLKQPLLNDKSNQNLPVDNTTAKQL